MQDLLGFPSGCCSTPNVSKMSPENVSALGNDTLGVLPSSSSLKWLNSTLGCIGFVGIGGNLLVCIVFLKIRKLRTLTNYLIVHQAAIDLITSILLVLYYLGPQFVYTADSVAGEILCRLWKSAYLLWTCFLASSFNLVVITFERYYAIIYPLHHATMFTNTRVAIILAAEWLVAAIFKSFNIYTQHFDRGHCKAAKMWVSAEFGNFVGVSNVFAQYLVPLAVMSVAYARCIIALSQKSLTDVAVVNSQDREAAQRDNSMKRASNNVLRMLVIVFVAYALCWGIPQLTFLAFCLGVSVDFGGVFYNVGVVIGFLNTSINPFIYALKYRQFQRGVRMVFCSKCLNEVGDIESFANDSFSNPRS
ncbi:neuromedin-U receptor 2-like [Ptychodera flava]|uniref:neuromedin-U receptor 2-like n=1 Tax=Ptychodera flava TaxID=63121 RepID=UPI00396A7170